MPGKERDAQRALSVAITSHMTQDIRVEARSPGSAMKLCAKPAPKVSQLSGSWATPRQGPGGIDFGVTSPSGKHVFNAHKAKTITIGQTTRHNAMRDSRSRDAGAKHHPRQPTNPQLALAQGPRQGPPKPPSGGEAGLHSQIVCPRWTPFKRGYTRCYYIREDGALPPLGTMKKAATKGRTEHSQ